MNDVLSMPLSEWRRIALRSESRQLIDYVSQFYDMESVEPLLLHPIERGDYDTGEMQAVKSDLEVTT